MKIPGNPNVAIRHFKNAFGMLLDGVSIHVTQEHDLSRLVDEVSDVLAAIDIPEEQPWIRKARGMIDDLQAECAGDPVKLALLQRYDLMP